MSAMLVGERIYLRPLRESDADGGYPDWLNDAETCAGNSHGAYPYTREEALDYIRVVRGARNALVLAVALRETDVHIGNVALQGINPCYRSAEFAILLGDKSSRGKGYGLEAARLICRHGFDALNLRRIACGTFSTNTAMIRLAEALGMTREGVRREAAYKAGQYLDVIEFGMLRDELR